MSMALCRGDVECMDPEERTQRQLEGLQSTLNRAFKNVPFYRNRFQERGIDVASIESLEDLARLPFTERRHLSDHYPYGLFAVPLRDIVRIHTAPGSTALNPTVSGYTRGDLALWKEMVARALGASGVTASDILQIHLDTGLANWARDYKDGAESMEAGVVPLTFLPLEKQLMVLRDYKTSVLITTPSAALQLVRVLFESEVNPNALNLETLVLVGETADDKTRAYLEERLHVKTWVHYGLSEVPGPALAFECESKQGLHVSEDHFYPEIVNPLTGDPLGEGEEGELILTSLTTRAFPLLRFRTGDRARFLPGACPHGCTLRRLAWLPGRTDRLVVLRGVKLHHRQVLTLLERALGFEPSHCRFSIRRRRGADFLEVRLGVDDRIFSDEIKGLERWVRDLGVELTQELGVPVAIQLQEKASFASPEGEAGLEDRRGEDEEAG